MVAGPAWPGYRPDVPASASLPTLRASLLLATAGIALLPAPALAQRMSPALLGNKDPVNRDPDAPPRRANAHTLLSGGGPGAAEVAVGPRRLTRRPGAAGG